MSAKRMIFDEMGQKISAEKSHLSSVIKERWKIDEESIPGKRDHTAVKGYQKHLRTVQGACVCYEDLCRPGRGSTGRSALKTEQMETALTKLENCRQRACDLIPAADTDYASQTRELAGVTKSLQTLLEEMEQFLIDTPLTTDYSAFKKAFEEVQARWNKVTENGEKAVEKLMANIKGAEAICHAFSKDPVNLSTGNFIYDRTDLEIGGRESFAFRRFYNAINAHRGVLGKDWNHNYEVHLEFTDGEAVLLREDGKEERFFWEKDHYLSLFASEGALEKEENGYTYRTRAQKTYRFDKEGKCLETESLTGSRITFAYEEEAPFRLVKVQKETGEFFAFFYDTEGMLERVEDHTGRGVAYKYQGELLKEATLPDGNAFRYGYTPQGKLEQVENPRGIMTVENFFDEEHRTTLQKFPDGTQMSYTYDEEKKTVELTERNGSRVVYVHDDKYRDIKHIHSNGEERFAYNQNNQKTLYVDRLGNKTQYAYDPAGNLVRVIDALGNKTEIRYGEKNQPTGIKINGREKLCGEYDAQGSLVMAFKYTEEQLNKLDKELLIQLFLGMQDQLEELTKQTQSLNDKMQLMMEQIVLSNKNRFGRSSEKMTAPGQIRFMEVDGKIVFF